ncbi:hypothetical protein ACWGMA_09510 [Streptomyces asiaticus]
MAVGPACETPDEEERAAEAAEFGEGADVGTLDEYGATPLHHAVVDRLTEAAAGSAGRER